MENAGITQDAKREIGEILKTRRLERHLTQRGLAQKSDLDYTYISKIESGIQPPSMDALVRLATTLEVSKAELNELLALMGRIPASLTLDERRRLAMHFPE